MLKFFKIYFFIILFSFPCKAEDIFDFEIEGISVGESALNYFNINEINENSKDWYNNNEYTAVVFEELPFFNTYEDVEINFKTNDNKYIIANVSGWIPMNYDKCMNKIDPIINDIKKNFKYTEFYDLQTYEHPIDNSGRSKVTDAMFNFESGSVDVQCYNMHPTTNYEDGLGVSISNFDFDDFLYSRAY